MDFLVVFVGVGDLEAARDEAGVDNLEELGVSDLRSKASIYFGFCTATGVPLLPLVAAKGEDSCSSESIRRWVLDLRRELARPPVMTEFYTQKICVIIVYRHSTSSRPWFGLKSLGK